MNTKQIFFIAAALAWVLAPAALRTATAALRTATAAQQTPVAMIESSDHYGYVDRNGKTVIPLDFEDANGFDAKTNLAGAKMGGKWGIIDRSGKWVVQPKFDVTFARFESMFDANGLAPVAIDKKFGVIDTKGNWVIEPKYVSLTKFDPTTRLAVAQQDDGKFGYIGMKGDWAIRPAFDKAESFDQTGFAKVTLNGKAGVIDNAGIMIAKAPDVTTGLRPVEKDGKHGYADANGDIVIAAQYDDAFPFDEKSGLAQVVVGGPYRKGGKVGLIDKTGKMVVQPGYSRIREFDGANGLFAAELNDKWGAIDKSGKWIIEPKLDSLGPLR